MDESETNKLKRAIRQLVKAEADMKLVADAASSVVGETWPRLLETGIVVGYCRAYTCDAKRRVPATVNHLPRKTSLRALHDRLLELRDTVHAHSDETDAREAVDPFGQHRYTESYRPFQASAFPRIARLAAHQRHQFRRERKRLEALLRDAEVPAEPTSAQ